MRLKIYLGHSRTIDYETLYKSIENSDLINKYDFLFPHKLDKNSRNGRSFYKKDNIDLFLAEVSEPSTGLGIELGWAFDEKIPIYCLYKKETKPNNSLKSVTSNFLEYDNIIDFINKIENILKN